MKKVITIILLALSSISSAQKIRFTDSRNVWLTKAYNADCLIFYRTYYYGTDTIIHGLTYQHLIEYNIPFPICMSLGYPIDGYYIREDTTAGKVYYIRLSYFSPDTLEHVLYDYNLTVGDSITYLAWSTYVDSVISTSSTIIGGTVHKMINLQNKYGYGTGYYTVVEGLGCVSGPLLLTYFGACFEYDEKVICFSQSGSYPVINVPFLDLCIDVPDTFHNSFGCVALNVDGKPVSSAIVNIHPNPAVDEISVTATSPLDNNTYISVYDFTGRCICHIPANEQALSTFINTSLWNNGVYLLVIQNKDGIIKKEKVVVLK